MSSFKNLSELTIGQPAVIEELKDNPLYLKMLEMGCLPGESIQIKSRAPLGDPLMIDISGYCLALRKSEAEHILVQEV